MHFNPLVTLVLIAKLVWKTILKSEYTIDDNNILEVGNQMRGGPTSVTWNRFLKRNFGKKCSLSVLINLMDTEFHNFSLPETSLILAAPTEKKTREDVQFKLDRTIDWENWSNFKI